MPMTKAEAKTLAALGRACYIYGGPVELRDIITPNITRHDRITALDGLERMGLVRVYRDGNPVKYEAVVG